ncbi:MAG: SDR family oxidoreductase [bacterium]|nr:SDR family oxidoreductase [bacterium]
MRILVTGASGLLGASVCRALCVSGHHAIGTYRSHQGPFPFPVERVDLRDETAVGLLVAQLRSECIIHCAALSRVIECEREPEAALAHNVLATRILAEYAERIGAHFIYLSTDQVFDGLSGDHAEHDLPAPTNAYGHSKAMAERIVQETCKPSLILRSNNIVGRTSGFGRSFTDGLLESLQNGENVTLFNDQTRSPIHLSVMTELIVRLVRERVTGILHAGGPERLSRYETGLRLARAYGFPEHHIRSVSVATHPDQRFLHRDGTFNTTKLRLLYPDLGNEPIDSGFCADAARG